jgi:hypothetical protein
MVKKYFRNLKFNPLVSIILSACLGVSIFALYAGQAQAFQFKTDNSDLKIRFDNTLTYSAMYRLQNQDPNLINADPTTDDGDRNFDKGIVMNRMDLLSMFDLDYNKYGVAFSGAAWYDTVYNTSNDNNSPATFNSIRYAHNEFTDETVKWHGKGAELLEAMTFGHAEIGNTTFRYRLGQFSQWWGDSFFLGWNGVAGELAPINVAKAASLPNVQLKELILPVPQAAGSLQATDNLSFNAYYQFKWKPSRLFATGSYFSPADPIGPGAETIMAWPGMFFYRIKDREPGNSGQYGINAKLETQFAAYGLYYNKFNAKDFMVVTTGLQMVTPPGAPDFVKIPLPTNYYLFYPKDIESYAVTVNKAIGEYTFAAEVTYRKNTPLQTDYKNVSGLGINFNTDSFNPLYAKGDTLNVILNTFSSGMRGNFFCNSQDLIAEVAYVKQLKVNNELWLDPRYEKEGLTGTIHYTPKWFEVVSGLDLQLPLILSYGFKGKPTSVLWSGQPHHGGEYMVGLYGMLNQVWEMEIDYRHFFGSTSEGVATTQPAFQVVGNQAFGDRNYVSFYIRRAF